MNKILHVIMPMAGEGSRFKEKGYSTPKPLLKVKDREIFLRAVDSIFDFDGMPWTDMSVYDTKVKLTFIVRSEFITDYHIDEVIHKEYDNNSNVIATNIIKIDKTTRGALETVSLAEKFIDKENDAICVMDCDFEFYCPDYLMNIKCKLFSNECYPLLISFYSKKPSYSYVDVGYTESDSYYAKNVVEKKQISTHALTGCYFLGRADRVIKCMHKVIKDFENGKIESKEIYLSLIYNYLIKEIGFFDAVKVIDMNLHEDHIWSYNTPDDYEKFDGKTCIWDK